MMRFQQHQWVSLVHHGWHPSHGLPGCVAATLQSPFFEVTHGAVRSWQRICHVGLGQKIWKMFIHLATWQYLADLALMKSLMILDHWIMVEEFQQFPNPEFGIGLAVR
jgi:hypothetical protein